MKYYAEIQSERGKVVGTGGNEYLDIDIKVGNKILARLTVREGEDGEAHVYDENDNDIRTANSCRKHRSGGCTKECAFR